MTRAEGPPAERGPRTAPPIERTGTNRRNGRARRRNRAGLLARRVASDVGRRRVAATLVLRTAGIVRPMPRTAGDCRTLLPTISAPHRRAHSRRTVSKLPWVGGHPGSGEQGGQSMSAWRIIASRGVTKGLRLFDTGGSTAPRANAVDAIDATICYHGKAFLRVSHVPRPTDRRLASSLGRRGKRAVNHDSDTGLRRLRSRSGRRNRQTGATCLPAASLAGELRERGARAPAG